MRTWKSRAASVEKKAKLIDKIERNKASMGQQLWVLEPLVGYVRRRRSTDRH